MKMKIFNNSPFKLPEYKTAEASGMDVRAWLSKYHSGNYEDFLQQFVRGEVIVTFDTNKTVMYGMTAENPIESIIIKPGTTVIIPSGIHVELPNTHEFEMRPKSGQSFKKGFTIVNSPGTIDSDYLGDISTIVGNFSEGPIPIFDGERISQLILKEKSPQVQWEEVSKISDLRSTDRGEGGFGSTGIK